MAYFKAVLGFLIPSVVLGILFGIYPGVRTYQYVWKDAQFCISCHVHDYASVGWRKSIHGDSTTCHDCHHQPLRAYIREAWVMIKDNPKFPKDLHHTPFVKTDLCAACHISNHGDKSTLTGPMDLSQVEKIPKVDLSRLHKIHLEKSTKLELLNSLELSQQERSDHPEPLKQWPQTQGAERNIACADCHGGPTNRGHNFSVTDVSCVRCHIQSHPSKVVEKFGCRSCHFQDFLAPLPAANK